MNNYINGARESVLNMGVFIPLFFLIFCFQSLTKANDIRDFEIEGISVGDNLLDHFTLDEINNAYMVQISFV